MPPVLLLLLPPVVPRSLPAPSPSLSLRVHARARARVYASAPRTCFSVALSKMKSDSKPLLTAQAEKANHYT